MHTIQITKLLFDTPAESVEDIKAFRKPVSNIIKQWRSDFDNAGIAIDLFYNRDEENNNNTIPRYPLIQYHSHEGNLAITGINEGAIAVQLLSKLLKEREVPDDVHYKGNKIISWSKHTISTHKHEIHLTDRLTEYVITNWLPLEDERYKLWTEMLSLHDRVSLLDEALPRQISKFLSAVGINYGTSSIAFVSNIIATENKIKEYNFRKLPFTCTFRCNINLPEGIGIGQVPSIGFGRISNL